ncbi:MAG: phage tail sheath subtilisin-like domain-containing protein [Thermosynechococcaceae cyanobacterium]
MPTVYQAPGVYVEEAPPAARPIAGVGTSTAAMIGVVSDNVKMPPLPDTTVDKDDANTPLKDEDEDKAKRLPLAPAGEPQLVTNWEEFKNSFGDLIPANKALDHRVLAQAVYGFFNNGGTRCWVMRVAKNENLDNLTEVLDKLEVIDEIAIVAVPGATKPTQQNAIIDHCDKMKDRVAILDGTPTPTALTSDAIRGKVEANPPSQKEIAPTKESSHAALYFPWIKIFDAESNAIVVQPPSGHIAGVYARVDGTRGVVKAPANEGIRGAIDLERKLTSDHQQGLNPDGINVIRTFNGNIKIWGARTLGGNSNQEFKYISTRRYFNFLRESIDEGTQFAVFEPNTPALWQQITRNVSDFLLGQWRNGALFGEKPEQAFFVKCDAETNPADVREQGQVVTEVGVAIAKPAEFVIFRIQQTTGG